MSKYVKYYYSDPVHFGDLAYNPVLDKTVVSKIRFGKRYTMAIVYDDDSQTIKFGLATCMPVDNFDKKKFNIVEYNTINLSPSINFGN